MRTIHCAFLAFFLALAPLRAGDWPQYRGPGHDNATTENIRLNWNEQLPRVLWTKAMSPALSSFAVSGKRLYTQGRRRASTEGDAEFCLALDADTGNELWAKELGRAYYPNGGVGGDDGPRSTPAIQDGRVFVLTSYLRLYCLDESNGNQIWMKELAGQEAEDLIPWQSAASPILHAGLVLVNANSYTGANFLAFRQSDGEVAWQGPTDRMTHATPSLATIDGVLQAVFFTQTGLVSLAPDNGQVLWRFPLNYNGTSVAASPVVFGNRVYASRYYPASNSRFQAGAIVVDLARSESGFTASKLWARTNDFMNHWATPVHHNGFIYGNYELSIHALKCIDGQTGEEKWSTNAFGFGSVTLLKDKLMVLGDNGTIALFEPNSAAYTEITRFRPLITKCWNSPAVSGGRIYVRGTERAVALDVSLPRPNLKLDVARSPSGAVLTIAPFDGTLLDSARAAGIGISATADIPQPNAGWIRLGEAPAFSDGKLSLTSGVTQARQFFRAEESQ